ncbi:MAG: acetate--CoA ligase family protein [Actinomycetota bacterium]|nr:acetate--CoA ligase family protein [Actinomycetota bacterium]
MATTDVTGRPVASRNIDLERLLRPKVIAVVGASDSPGSQSALNYRMIHGWSDTLGRKVVPINPNRDSVGGEKCYASLKDAPDEIDVAVVITSDAAGALRDAADAAIPFVVIFTAGFSETGDEGVARQQEIEEIIASSGVHVLGPNTPLNSFQPFREDLPGKRIGLITQSGHQGRPIYQAQELGVALDGWAPTGNESDLESADFIRYFADRSEVGAIACYLEGFKDGRTLMLALDHAAQKRVPVTMIKVGRSDIGRSWAKSHSGHLAGSDAVTSAVLRQYGVTRVDGLDELLDVSKMFARSASPAGDGVAIYSISGGTSAHMADWAASMGLRMPELTMETQRTLREWIPGFLRVSNPIDSGGIATGDERGPKILDAILADPHVDVLIAPVAGSFSPISDKLARDLVAAAEKADKPVCVIWGSPTADEEGYREVLVRSQVPLFRSARNCLVAVKAYLDYHAFLSSYKSPYAKPVVRPLPAARTARALLRDGASLSEHRSKELLAAYGIPVTKESLAVSAKEAVRAAELIGYPVVMKGSSQSLLHKSDLGLVRLNVPNAHEVRTTFTDLMKIDRVDAVLVSEMISGGIETVVGVSRDEIFGPVIMFGLGGIAVEVFKDVTFRVPPFDKRGARLMLQEIKAFPLLQGARGRPKADLRAIVDVIMKVQRLAMDLSDDMDELDINPLVALPDRAVALDALVVAR